MTSAIPFGTTAHAESNRRVCYQLFSQTLERGTHKAWVALWGKTSISDWEACNNIHSVIDSTAMARVAETPYVRPAEFSGQVDSTKWVYEDSASNAPCEELQRIMQLGDRDPCFDVEVSPGSRESVKVFLTPALVVESTGKLTG